MNRDYTTRVTNSYHYLPHATLLRRSPRRCELRAAPSRTAKRIIVARYRKYYLIQ